MGDQYPFPTMGMHSPSLSLKPPPRSSSSQGPATTRSPEVHDRRFACTPFFLPLSYTISPSPFRLRGGGGGGRKDLHAKAQTSTSTARRSEPMSRVKTRSSRASPLTDLDKLKIEEAAVRSEVSRLNLALRDVEGDGNCLFRALSDQLYGDQKRHPEIRKLTCDYLEAHEDDLGYWAGFCSFLEGEDYGAYVKRMRKSGQYASEVEVHAAARMLRRSIRIVHKDHSETIPCDFDPSSAPTATPPVEESGQPRTPDPDSDEPGTSSPSHRRRTRSSTICLLSTSAAPPPSSRLYASVLAQYLPPIRDGRCMLWLALFNDAEHYQSVRRKGDRERVPAEVEDRLALPHEKDQSESARIDRGELAGPSSLQTKTDSASVRRVIASLPPGHTFSADHISGILARVKGDVGEAVEVLLEKMDADDAGSEGSTGTRSDLKVEQMLVYQSYDESDLSSPEMGRSAQPVGYREDHRSSSLSPPPRQDSPTGSSSTTGSQSYGSRSDISHSSKDTTPSTQSLKSERSKRSVSDGSGSGRTKEKDRSKPYDRPSGATRKDKDMSKKLEELRVGAAMGESLDQGRRGSTGEQTGRCRNIALEALKAKRKAKVSVEAM